MAYLSVYITQLLALTIAFCTFFLQKKDVRSKEKLIYSFIQTHFINDFVPNECKICLTF